MTKDEALKQALEALEYIENNYMSLPKSGNEAITAIKQALAAPVQEPVGTYGEVFESMRSLLRSGRQADQQIYMAMQHKPLYTTPPAAKRQWVGLTDEEVMQTMSGNWTSQFYFARAIEAKLKEKNV
jgi:hypothetical protein